MQEAFARGLFTRPYDMPQPLKKSCVMAEYIQRNYQNKFYAKAMNLVQVLTKAYDDVLKEYDVLIMPTVPIKPTALPTGNDDLKGS